MQSFTRDVSCFVGCQECNRVGDFLCAAEATRRNLRQDTRTLVIAQRTCHVRFSKSLAREVASRGITVNVVAPGFIETDMTRALSDDQRAGILAQVPAGRLGGAQEIANAVAFLASDEAAYITGETLHVNGGMYMV